MIIALVAVVAIFNRGNESDSTGTQSPPEVAEAWIGAFLGGDPELAVALIHPLNDGFGDISDPATQNAVKDYSRYFSIIGTESSAECTDLATGGTVSCSATTTNSIYEAVGAGPAVADFTLTIKDGLMIVRPNVGPPSTEVEPHYALWARANYAEEYAAACQIPGSEFFRPPCAEFQLAHLDEWAAAWRADQAS